MPHLKTERCIVKDKNERIDFNYKIYVDKEGNFSTTLPEEITKQLKEAGIELYQHRNRQGTEGYFCSSSLPTLKKQVEDIVNEMISREMIVEKRIIKYQISTSCQYVLSKNTAGVPVPNGYFREVEEGEYEACVWKTGTIGSSALQSFNRPYGLQVYAVPFFKRCYEYKSGKKHVEYEKIYGSHGDKENEKYLNRLASFKAVMPIDREDMQEIDYDELVAKFFYNLIISICKINEQIIDFLDPESIKKLAEGNVKMLGD